MDLGLKERESRIPGHKITGEVIHTPEATGARFADGAGIRHSEQARNRVEKHPVPAVSGDTKKKVHRQLRRVAAEGKLNHHPHSVAEWQMVKWYLAHKLNLSPLRIVFLFSEASAANNSSSNP